MDKALDKNPLVGSQSFVPVSVIIPCYRCAETIRAAVDSVAKQTSRPMEIILVEDFSQDNGQTLKALEAIQRDLRGLINIIIISLTENRGAGESRNAGWQVASQKFVAFLDADDTWHPRKLEIQSAWMIDHADFLLSCHDSQLCLDGKFPRLDANSYLNRKITWWRLLFINDIAMRTVMIKRDIDHRFPVGIRYAEDLKLWLRILRGGDAAMRIGLPLACSYKEEFGSGGLSGNLVAMHKGVLLCIHELYEEQLISVEIYCIATTFEKIKFLRRILVMKIRKIKAWCRHTFFTRS